MFEVWIMSPLGGNSKQLSLPMDNDDLQKEIDNLVGKGHDYIIADIESPLNDGSKFGLFDLNEFASLLDDLGDYEKCQVLAKIENEYCSLGDALEGFDEYMFLTESSYSDDIQEALFDWWCEINYEIVHFAERTQYGLSIIDNEYIVRNMKMENSIHTNEFGTCMYLG